MPTTVPLHSPDFYAGDPYPIYRELRTNSPVVWNDVTNFWALAKYEDIRFVSSNPAHCSPRRRASASLTPPSPNPFRRET